MKFKFVFLTFFLITVPAFAAENISEIKQSAFALYNTGHFDEAYEMLIEIPNEEKDEDVYLILSNIEKDNKQIQNAVNFLKMSMEKKPEFYKAYYNLGCIYSENKDYKKAVENYKLSVKYNNKNPYVYYNLGVSYMELGEFSKAKKNFIKGILLKNDDKDFYYNLAYANKKLGKEKDAKKIIDFYNKTFVK